jgi:hypothetical protein
MKSATRVVTMRLLVVLLLLLTGISLGTQPASAQRWHHRHRVVIVRHVWRHGHRVTIRRVVWR